MWNVARTWFGRWMLPAGVGLLLAGGASRAADPYQERLATAQQALETGDTARAIAETTTAAELAPTRPEAFWLRGQVYDQLGMLNEALADYDRVLSLDPQAHEVWDRRGSVHFKRADIERALADFDRYLTVRPDQAAGHWRRGIALYYARRFAEGQRQFEAYQEVDGADVENVVWRFLCQARASDVATARRELLPVGPDPRVPMAQIYALFAGRGSEADVLAAVAAGMPGKDALADRQFYAELYLGLYYEAQKNVAASRAAIDRAVALRRPHYMANVARVHQTLRAAAAQTEVER